MENAPTTALAAPEPRQRPIVVIRPSNRLAAFSFRELWAYRELLYFLIWRDIKVRYKQTALGAGWAVIQPVMLMIVFSIVFHQFANVPSDGIPYPLFAFAGLVPWTFFAQALGGTAGSLVGNANLIGKVYFPRIIMPVAAAASFLVDFVIALGVCAGIMAWYGVVPSWHVVFLPLLTLLALLTSLAVGVWLAALNVKYRDVRYAVPFLVQLWLFATPVAYAASLVPDRWHWVYALNPMAGVVEGFRWAIVDTKTAPGLMLGISTLATIGILITGLAYFRKVEQTFADVI